MGRNRRKSARASQLKLLDVDVVEVDAAGLRSLARDCAAWAAVTAASFNIGGNSTVVHAFGVFNNATNLFGNDSIVAAGNVPAADANLLQSIGGNVAFNGFGPVR